MTVPLLLGNWIGLSLRPLFMTVSNVIFLRLADRQLAPVQRRLQSLLSRRSSGFLFGYRKRKMRDASYREAVDRQFSRIHGSGDAGTVVQPPIRGEHDTM